MVTANEKRSLNPWLLGVAMVCLFGTAAALPALASSTYTAQVVGGSSNTPRTWHVVANWPTFAGSVGNLCGTTYTNNYGHEMIVAYTFHVPTDDTVEIRVNGSVVQSLGYANNSGDAQNDMARQMTLQATVPAGSTYQVNQFWGGGGGGVGAPCRNDSNSNDSIGVSLYY